MFNTRNYLIISSSYMSFTLTDGAIRMIVLLYFFHLGYSPFTLALLFLLYELAGIITNLTGGWLTSKFGIKKMLNTGISFQISGLVFLSLLNSDWNASFSIFWILTSQGISGVAKDITKTSSKSAIKALSGNHNHLLFKWVSWLTGFKNLTKGVGFFIGAFLISSFNFTTSLYVLILFLGIVLICSLLFLENNIGKFKSSKSVQELFSKSLSINLLSMARVFLFGARDIWFVVGLPVFLYSQGFNFWMVGAYIAFWTIGYGFVQSMVPSFLRRSNDGLTIEVSSTKKWIIVLTSFQFLLFIFLLNDWSSIPILYIASFGLIVFGIVFAINSALHSYLILAYSDNKKTSENVGFYYASNASGRFIGTFLSGLMFQIGGLSTCVGGSLIMLIICSLITINLPIKK